MPNPRKSLVSVIISTKNEAMVLPRLLQSIQQQIYSPIEVIVVDNNSDDNTVAIAKSYTSQVYTAGNERSSQRNFGAVKAHGKYVLFLDADMELVPSIIKDCVAVLQKKSAVAVIIPEDVKITNFFSRMKQLEKRIYWNEPCIEAARFFEKKVFLKAGGYNENLISGEDWDLSYRISKIGKLARIDTPLFHQETSLFRELKHKMYYTRHIGNYARLHPDQFRRQSGKFRIRLLYGKGKLFKESPFVFISVCLLKGCEFMLYQCFLIYNKLRQNNKNI